jgi:hypothetical protein
MKGSGFVPIKCKHINSCWTELYQNIKFFCSLLVGRGKDQFTKDKQNAEKIQEIIQKYNLKQHKNNLSIHKANSVI